MRCAAVVVRCWAGASRSERERSAPVVEMNRAVAVAMVDGPAAGLAILDRPDVGGQLGSYRWLHSTRADLLRRLGRFDDASAAYARALALSDSRAERAFLTGRLREMHFAEHDGRDR